MQRFDRQHRTERQGREPDGQGVSCHNCDRIEFRDGRQPKPRPIHAFLKDNVLPLHSCDIGDRIASKTFGNLLAPHSVCWIRNNPAEEKIHSAVYPRGHDMPRNQAEAMGCSPHLRESNMLTQRKGRGTGVPETIREPTSIREPSRNLRSRRMRNPRYSVAQTSKSAVSRISKSASHPNGAALPTWKSAIQQVWKPALRPRKRLCAEQQNSWPTIAFGRAFVG